MSEFELDNCTDCGGESPHDKKNVCCNIFTDTLGAIIQDGSDITLAIATAVLQTYIDACENASYVERGDEVQRFYISAIEQLEEAFLRAQKQGCGAGCCKGLASGIKKGSLGFLKLTVTRAYLILIPIDKVKENIDTDLKVLRKFLKTELALSGCKKKDHCGC